MQFQPPDPESAQRSTACGNQRSCGTEDIPRVIGTSQPRRLSQLIHWAVRPVGNQTVCPFRSTRVTTPTRSACGTMPSGAPQLSPRSNQASSRQCDDPMQWITPIGKLRQYHRADRGCSQQRCQFHHIAVADQGQHAAALDGHSDVLAARQRSAQDGHDVMHHQRRFAIQESWGQHQSSSADADTDRWATWRGAVARSRAGCGHSDRHASQSLRRACRVRQGSPASAAGLA